MESLPFTISQWLGAARAAGLLRREGQSLLFEFELKDGLLGVLRSQVREVRISLADIESIAWQSGWLADEIKLQTRTLRASQGLPGHDCGTVRLSISKQDRKLAQQLVVAIQAEQSVE